MRPPQALPEEVTRVVEQVTGGVSSPYLKAKAINDYFTDGSQGFTYALSTLAGSSGSVLVDFLRNKQGYCEQYAAAMAVMLRLADIPSRVVIGYTPGRRQDDGTYIVSTADAHAWVEAYFQGVGWTYFDPTPLEDGRTVAPGYAPRPEASPTASSTASTGATPSAGPTRNQLDPFDVDPGVASPDTPGQVLTAQRAVIGGVRARPAAAAAHPGAGPAVVPAAAAGDRGWAGRGGGRAGGLGRGDRDGSRTTGCRRHGPRRRAGWRDDSGGTCRWMPTRPGDCGWSRSPRSAPGTRRGPGVDGDLPSAVRAVRRGLRADAGRRQRWRATLLPPSTVLSARSGSALRAANASSALSRLGEAVRRPVTPRRR